MTGEAFGLGPMWQPIRITGVRTVTISEEPTSPAGRISPHPGNCDTYWGSHGCDLLRGHDGPCDCGCCECENHLVDHHEQGCVGKAPYYGPETNFYGDDIPEQTVEATRLLVIEERRNDG